MQIIIRKMRIKRYISFILISFLLYGCTDKSSHYCGSVYYQTTDFSTFTYYHQQYMQKSKDAKRILLFDLDIISDKVLYSFSGSRAGEEMYQVSEKGVLFKALAELPLENNKKGYAIVFFKPLEDFKKEALIYQDKVDILPANFPIQENAPDFLHEYNDYLDSLSTTVNDYEQINNRFYYTLLDEDQKQLLWVIFNGYKDSSLTREYALGIMDILQNKIVSIL